MKQLMSPCCNEPMFDHREEDGWVWCAQCWKEFDKQLVLDLMQAECSITDLAKAGIVQREFKKLWREVGLPCH